MSPSQTLPAQLEGRHVLCSVLDVLGYKGRLEADRNSGQPNFKRLLQRAMAVLNEVNEAECAYEAISDTILLIWPAQETLKSFLELNKRLFVAFLEQGLYLRGGITYSQHFKSGNVTYSFAIARAHEIESKQAVHPRIVLDKNIILTFQQAESGLDYQSLVLSKLVAHVNGTYFLNVIDEENWTLLHESAKKIYEHDAEALLEQENAFSKHVWFENFLYQSNFATDADRYIPLPLPIRNDDGVIA